MTKNLCEYQQATYTCGIPSASNGRLLVNSFILRISKIPLFVNHQTVVCGRILPITVNHLCNSCTLSLSMWEIYLQCILGGLSNRTIATTAPFHVRFKSGLCEWPPPFRPLCVSCSAISHLLATSRLCMRSRKMKRFKTSAEVIYERFDESYLRLSVRKASQPRGTGTFEVGQPR